MTDTHICTTASSRHHSDFHPTPSSHAHYKYMYTATHTHTPTMAAVPSKSDFKKACNAFVQLQPDIKDLKEQLKAKQKQVKQHVSIIRSYMESHQMTNLDIAGFTFTQETKQRLPWSEKNVAALLQDESFFEEYRRQFTQEKPSFSYRPPKRVRKDDQHTDTSP